MMDHDFQCSVRLTLNTIIVCVRLDAARHGRPMLRTVTAALLLFFALHAAPAHADDSAKDYRRANNLFAAGKYKDAILLYEKLIASPPPDASIGDIYSKIGDGYFQLGDFGRALSAYRSALRNQKRPGRVETQYWIGFCCFLLGRDQEAVAELLKIPELYPGSGMWAATAYYWAGRASERIGWKDKAVEYYKKAGAGGKGSQTGFALKRAAGVKKQM